MIYVIDTNSLNVLRNFYPETFPSFWEQFDGLVADGGLISVEEVLKEVRQLVDAPHVTDWADQHSEMFEPPTEEEMEHVAEIFSVRHFQQLISKDKLLRGGHVADPWLIARARAIGGCVVTEEKLKPNAAKIPNVCQHFGVGCRSMQGLLSDQGWRY